MFKVGTVEERDLEELWKVWTQGGFAAGQRQTPYKGKAIAREDALRLVNTDSRSILALPDAAHLATAIALLGDHPDHDVRVGYEPSVDNGR